MSIDYMSCDNWIYKAREYATYSRMHKYISTYGIDQGFLRLWNADNTLAMNLHIVFPSAESFSTPSTPHSPESIATMEALGKVLRNIWDFIAGIATWVWNWICDKCAAIKTWFKNLFTAKSKTNDVLQPTEILDATPPDHLVISRKTGEIDGNDVFEPLIEYQSDKGWEYSANKHQSKQDDSIEDAVLAECVSVNDLSACLNIVRQDISSKLADAETSLQHIVDTINNINVDADNSDIARTLEKNTQYLTKTLQDTKAAVVRVDKLWNARKMQARVDLGPADAKRYKNFIAECQKVVDKRFDINGPTMRHLGQGLTALITTAKLHKEARSNAGYDTSIYVSDLYTYLEAFAEKVQQWMHYLSVIGVILQRLASAAKDASDKIMNA